MFFLLFFLLFVKADDLLPILPYNYTMSSWWWSWTKGFYVYAATNTSVYPRYTLETYCPNFGGASYGYNMHGLHFLDTHFSSKLQQFNLTYINGVIRYLLMSNFSTNETNYTGPMFMEDENHELLFDVRWAWDNLALSIIVVDRNGEIVAVAQRSILWPTYHVSGIPGVTSNQTLIDVSFIIQVYEYHLHNRGKDGCTGLVLYGLPTIGALLLVGAIVFALRLLTRRRTYETVPS
eukprot:TRINITY_DN2192_c0_g1_i3.p1 TRINITY_DN2192_c0_g1~~TRINITY_DN2192_c0_g1_i3.p1  ORF type:complete len:235 (+),score=26.14 TRINITY_DN2192_c0_g1_i3:271-975(+)